MAGNQTAIGVYEGYQVFANNEEPEVKQEPIDPDFEKVGQPEDGCKGGASKSVRELLKQMVENKNKDLSVKTVVEKLLIQNELLLAQSDAQALKPNRRTVKPKNTEQSFESHGSILTPSDPTESCSKEDIPDINNALIEVPVNEANETNGDSDLVCAVASKIILMTPQGQPLQMDLTYYWCNFCCYKSENKANLLKHVMEHRFNCKYCKFQSFSRAAVIHHCTKEHECSSESAGKLKYCTYLPDLLMKNEMKKRKIDTADDIPSAKKSRVHDTETLDMVVEEVPTTEDPATTTKTIQSSLAETENTKVPLDHSPVPKGTENILPMISNVFSGQKAVDAAITKAMPDVKPNSLCIVQDQNCKYTSPGLCWNCGYCSFMTLSQSFLKIHLNAQHQGKTHKYVAMLVSSEKELTRIKEADAKIYSNSTGDTNVLACPSSLMQGPSSSSSPQSKQIPSGPQASKSSAASHKMPGIEIDIAEDDASKVQESEQEKKIPLSFKCAHCNYNNPKEEIVKDHLLQRHSGCVIYALDMRAVKLRQKRYIFFCLKTKCSFKTKEIDEYLAHMDKCTPWLDGTKRKTVNPTVVKSLLLTKMFIENIANGTSFGTDLMADKSVEYACIYCSYISSNNTSLKKHVLTNHPNKRCIIRDVPATKAKKRNTIYFCNFCLWETREDSGLKIHLDDRHGNVRQTKQPAVHAAPLSQNSQPKENKEASSVTQDEKGKSLVQKRIPVQEMPSSSEEEYKSDSNDNGDVEDNEEGNEYIGVIPSDQYDKAMTEYLESENPDSKKGRPSRKSALKCRMKVKSMKAPPLYECDICSETHFGPKLMKQHLQNEHKNEPLRAIDVLKQYKKNPDYFVLFCPLDNCIFIESSQKDLINHAKDIHGILDTDEILVKIKNSFFKAVISRLKAPKGGRPPSTKERFECLYCVTSVKCHSRQDMKIHLLNEHNGEEFIYRNCVARKLGRTCRFYMCHDFHCEFTTEKQKDYLLHMLSHQKAKIFECTECQWFTSVSEEVENHCRNVHNREKVVTLEVDLDLDSTGNIVRSVNGTIIKSER